MGLATAVLHWPPHVFWQATSHEFHAALEMMAEIKKRPED